MDQNIDLTENGIFGVHMYDTEGIYNHRTLPWEKDEKNGLVELSSNVNPFTRFKPRNDYFISLDRWLNNVNILSSRNNNMSYVSTLYDYTFNTSIDFIPTYYMSSVDEYNTVDIRDIDESSAYPSITKKFDLFSYGTGEANIMKVFPTGTRDEINNNRKREVKESKYHKYLVKAECYTCGKPISKAPWNYKDDTFTYTCESCDKDVDIPFKEYSLKKRWYGNKSFMRRRLSFNRFDDEEVFSDVPSLSNEIEHKQPIAYIHNRNILNLYSFYEDRSTYRHKEVDIDEPPFSKKVLDDALYYKGKKKPRIRDVLQPRGRVPQPYDEMFEKLDWRESLDKRLALMNENI